MAPPTPKEVTRILREWSNGDREAVDRLLPLVYDELRRLADHYLRLERPDHTLQATALAHEAYLRLVDQTNVQWEDRAHFMGIAAHLMRQVLVDHARRHCAGKRGGGHKLSLDEAIGFYTQLDSGLVALDDTLTNLATLDSQQSGVVELRFFGGLTVAEIGRVMEVSPTTVKREWRMAKAWLRREIQTTGSRPHVDHT